MNIIVVLAIVLVLEHRKQDNNIRLHTEIVPLCFIAYIFYAIVFILFAYVINLSL